MRRQYKWQIIHIIQNRSCVEITSYVTSDTGQCVPLFSFLDVSFVLHLVPTLIRQFEDALEFYVDQFIYQPD